MIRGIGDPLVATYARCYLVRVGLTVSAEKNYIKENFNDFLSVYHAVRHTYHLNIVDTSYYSFTDLQWCHTL